MLGVLHGGESVAIPAASLDTVIQCKILLRKGDRLQLPKTVSRSEHRPVYVEFVCSVPYLASQNMSPKWDQDAMVAAVLNPPKREFLLRTLNQWALAYSGTPQYDKFASAEKQWLALNEAVKTLGELNFRTGHKEPEEREALDLRKTLLSARADLRQKYIKMRSEI